MNRSRFLTFFIILLTSFLFIKVYQHNKIVKLLYAKQRIEREKIKLEKKRDQLLVNLYTIKSQESIRLRAETELGMQALKPSQIVVLSSFDNLTSGTGKPGTAEAGAGKTNAVRTCVLACNNN